MDPVRLQRAFGLLQRWAASDQVQGSAVAVVRHGILLEPGGFGVRTAGPAQFPILPDNVFLVASVTKPVAAMAALLLALCRTVVPPVPWSERTPTPGWPVLFSRRNPELRSIASPAPCRAP